jgi:C4-dicarboxylate transporter
LQKAWSDSRIVKEEDEEEVLVAYSKDRRFILQRVTSDQAKVLTSILPAYYAVPPFPPIIYIYIYIYNYY